MDKYAQILTRFWGYSKFRALQEDIIRSIDSHKDTLGLMPTGGGKSITFQVYSMAHDGICIVVTPLIALMKDQVENLKSRGINAIAIFSGMSPTQIDIALDNCVYGDVKFLYVSPERLATDMFRARVQKMNVNLITVDEAHCISQWGYDFRPSYLNIASIRELLPGVHVLALTATATPMVVDDIQQRLKFKVPNAIKQSFERKNLIYIVRNIEDKTGYLLKSLKSQPGSAVVYVRSRNRTKEISEMLVKNNISADYYHAGLENHIRDTKQAAWKKGETRVIVATNAFGMGIDKPDVRLVVHIDLPDSLEAYFQEAGRAGRDEKKAYALLLYNESDKLKLERSVDESFPDTQTIKNVYNALGNFFQLPVGAGKFASFDFNIFEFCKRFKFSAVIAFNSLKILETCGYLELTEELNTPSLIHFTVERDDLYKFQVANSAYDVFIKLLLRNTPGVFSGYAAIDEQSLAKKTLADVDVIKKYLTHLKSRGIIDYIPRKTNPCVVYTEERLDEKSLLFSPEVYQQRKERYIDRINAVVRYASSNNKCRSQLLLAYFGDDNSYRCGQCDVCARRNELGLSKYEFDQVLEQVKSIVKKEALALNDLLEKVPVERNKVINTVQWLLDNNKIYYNSSGKLEWHN